MQDYDYYKITVLNPQIVKEFEKQNSFVWLNIIKKGRTVEVGDMLAWKEELESMGFKWSKDFYFTKTSVRRV